MSFGETFISVSPTGSTQLRTITGSAGRHIEVIALTDQNLNIILPNQINITGSVTHAITGSSITNTQPVGITGSITQGTTPWQITYTGSQPVTFTTPIGVTQSTTPWVITGSITIITGSFGTGSFLGNNSQSFPQLVAAVGGLQTSNSSLRAFTTDASGNLNITGQLQGSQASVISQDAATGALEVIGTFTDNSANSTLKLPILPAKASSTVPALTEGRQQPLYMDLSGNLKITGSVVQSYSGSSTQQWVVIVRNTGSYNFLLNASGSNTNPNFASASQPAGSTVTINLEGRNTVGAVLYGSGSWTIVPQYSIDTLTFQSGSIFDSINNIWINQINSPVFTGSFFWPSLPGVNQVRLLVTSTGSNAAIISGSLVAVHEQNTPSSIFGGTIGVTGSIMTITGSSIANTQPINITGSVLQSGVWTFSGGTTGSIAVTGSTVTGPPVAITGSIINLNNTIWPISGSSATNTFPINITGSILQSGTWNITNITGTVPGFSGSSIPISITGSTIAGIAPIISTTVNIQQVSGSTQISTGSSGVLTTTSANGNQQIVTYLVTAGKTLYLTNLDLSADFTTLSATGAYIGSGSLTGSGWGGRSSLNSAILTQDFQNLTDEQIDWKTWVFTPPMFFTGSSRLAVVANPSGTTSTRWRANLVGYEV